MSKTTNKFSPEVRERAVRLVLETGVRLMQPSYVKGHVKRGKTDKADAEAICGEA